MEKIIFLDVDGVICLYPEYQSSWINNMNTVVDDRCCLNLKAILEATGAKIVVSSSWRFGKHLISLYRQLAHYDITEKHVAGFTGDLSWDDKIKSHNELRWREIKEYIDEHKIKKYIILDDFNVDKYDKQHVIKTKMHVGLTARLKDVAISKLNSEV